MTSPPGAATPPPPPPPPAARAGLARAPRASAAPARVAALRRGSCIGVAAFLGVDGVGLMVDAPRVRRREKALRIGGHDLQAAVQAARATFAQKAARGRLVPAAG